MGFVPVGKGAWGEGEEALDGSNPTYYYAGQELLEVSVVNIPANPNALKKSLEAQEEELAALRAEAQPAPEPEQDPEPEEPVKEEPVSSELEVKDLDELEIRKKLSIAGAALL